MSLEPLKSVSDMNTQIYKNNFTVKRSNFSNVKSCFVYPILN